MKNTKISEQIEEQFKQLRRFILLACGGLSFIVSSFIILNSNNSNADFISFTTLIFGIILLISSNLVKEQPKK